MDHTPGQGQYTDVEKYVAFMTRWLGFDPEKVGADVLKRIENAIEDKVTHERDWNIVRQVVQVARQYGIPVASHDDDTAQKVDDEQAMGVSISEFPVTHAAAHAARRHGMHVIMGAPNAYRGASTGNNLSAREAVRLGLVDILATDYFPAAMLHAAFLLADLGVRPLHESLKLVSQNPAEAMGLTDRGRLAVGCAADLVLVETGGAHPRVRGTLRRGVPIYRDSAIFGQMQRELHAAQE
jgi:alpha-D-ribose 1-methylphosphonate 5-triphosphate diphosphatase